MNLLVDLGNSRLKWAWSGPDGLQVGEPVDHAELLQGSLARVWADAPHVSRVLVASVARPRLEAELAQAVRQQLQIEPQFVASCAELLGVRVAYAQPQSFGVDRLLALVALHARSTRPSVLVSVGTALVLDALDTDGQHLGGLIAPNPRLMQQALLGATARLGSVSRSDVVEIATSTDAAVVSGCWLAAAALVERFHASAKLRFAQTPDLVLSGGAADDLPALLGVPARIEADLVLRGLALYAQNEGGLP